MSVVLLPLLTGLETSLLRLRDMRLTKPVSFLLPEWSDPGLADPVPPEPTEAECALRVRISAIAAQLRRVGVAVTVRAALRHPVSEPALRPVLLAAAGFAAWEQDAAAAPAASPWPGAYRLAGDGQLYRLDSGHGGGAEHAEHAAAHVTQRLAMQRGSGPMTEATDGVATVHCLSIACALRDVILSLREAGEALLADEMVLALAPHWADGFGFAVADYLVSRRAG
jgi:hypothetical protein